ncbi:MAG: DJ-1/PfpI family protein [Sphaerochaetaceae bacterium]|nr:DJ-1/PfpI family protein [Sphaerochaetaceae bacterium]
MKKRVLVTLAEGFEEIEALAPVDILRRAGADVVIAGVDGEVITGGHGIKVVADAKIEDVDTDFDAIILPGGGLGAKNLSESWLTHEKMLLLVNKGALLASICASPAVVLGPAGLLNGHQAVCYPGAEEHAPDFTFSDMRVCVDGNLITAQGAGVAVEFALAIVEHLFDKTLRDSLSRSLLHNE